MGTRALKSERDHFIVTLELAYMDRQAHSRTQLIIAARRLLRDGAKVGRLREVPLRLSSRQRRLFANAVKRILLLQMEFFPLSHLQLHHPKTTGRGSASLSIGDMWVPGS